MRNDHIAADFGLAESHQGDVSENFASNVHNFLSTNLTNDLRDAGRQTTGVYSEISACRVWHNRLFKKGWIAPAWPAKFGGTGWSIAQRLYFEHECARADAPILFATGLRSIGPLIIAMGTADQKERYLAPILSGDHLWCQGFSEAAAGSDLAALTSRATRSGAAYVVNGRKLWTTGAHISSHMFALVRTGTFSRRQDGITFLLMDMKSPGISIQPIVTLDGHHEFNEVTFDDVIVPVAGRVGAEHEGWHVAKYLMRMARSNNTNSALLRRAWRAVERLTKFQTNEQKDELALRRAQIELQLTAFESLELSLLKAGRLSGDDNTASSLMKITATELHQRITQLLLALAGPYAVAGSDFAHHEHGILNQSQFATQKYLATRAASIYSGTNEIHRNLIANSLIGITDTRPKKQ